MVGRAFSVKIDLDLHAISCPGVWLCPNGKVTLQINIFDSCVATHRLTPIFPLLYHNKFTFKKVFTGVTTLVELEKKLYEEYIFAELVQWSSTANRNVSLAIFETNLVDLLYPVPCFKGLLSGVDVDLLMEPSKFFPGILAPKIEVSTKTTIEEVTDFDVHPAEARVINPKVINSVNQRCIHKKKESTPNRGILRQKRVCHSGHGKLDSYKCRLCRRQQSNVETIHNCKPHEQCSISTKDQCYLSTPKKRQICSCSSLTAQKYCENYSICSDAHLLDSCPICFKYKCYFNNKNTGLRSPTKLHDLTNREYPLNKCTENRTNPFIGNNCINIRKNCNNSISKLSSGIDSLNLQNDRRNCNHKIYNEENCHKYSSQAKHKKDSICQSNSAPSLKDDSTTSILLAKMKQLEKTKQRLNYANCPNRDSDHASSYDDIQNDKTKKGFYKNLEKFYKRMYKQAKKRANDLDET